MYNVSSLHINRNSVDLTYWFSLKLFYFTFVSQWDPLKSINRHLFYKKKSVKIPNTIPLCKFYFSLFCRYFYEIILRLMSASMVYMFCAQNEQLIIKCLKIGALHTFSPFQFLSFIPGPLILITSSIFLGAWGGRKENLISQ